MVKKYTREAVAKDALFKRTAIHKFPIAIVYWTDAASCDYWMELKDKEPQECIPGTHSCVTIGHVIARSDESVTIAATYANSKTGDTSVCNVMTIPVGSIETMYQLTPEN